MIDFNTQAVEVFQTLRSYDYEVLMYDDDGNQVYEPEQSRRFFAKPENLLVSIIEEGDDSSVRMYLSKSTDVSDIKGLITTLRRVSTKYNTMFNVKKYGRDLEPKDFSTRSSVTEKKDSEVPVSMKITEGMYGTSRSSYLKLENARMIVRHASRVNEEVIGGRSRNIDQIFIENKVGERFLFPTNNLYAARAMTQHVNNNGNFADAVGEQIQRMATDYSNLATCAHHVRKNMNSLAESALEVRSHCRSKMREMRNCFERLYRPSGYIAESERIAESAQNLLENEDDVVTSEDIDGLRDLIFVEGSEINDEIIETVCRTMKEKNEISERTQHLGYVKVLGKEVDKAGWEEFKNGQIDLMKTPSVPETTRFGSKADELVIKFGEIFPLMKNDSLLNLFSYIHDEFKREREPGRRDKMVRIMLHALNIVGMKIEENITSAKLAVVEEFNQWANSVTFESVFTPNGINEDVFGNFEFDDGDEFGLGDDDDDYGTNYGSSSEEFSDDYIETSLSAVKDSFSAENFMSSAYADGITDEMEGNVIYREYIMNRLEDYLLDKLETDFDVDADVSQLARDVYPSVENYLDNEGYSVSECDEEGRELSREDIVIPTSKEEDFRAQTTLPREPDELERLKFLSGVRSTNYTAR